MKSSHTTPLHPRSHLGGYVLKWSTQNENQSRHTRARQRLSQPMFEEAFRNMDDVLRKEVGCTTELDYATQAS
jgi:hypothetical protein